jgi:hypothetical protein
MMLQTEVSIPQELLKRFDALTAKIGEAGGTAWGWYVRQSVIDGAEALAVAGVLLAAAVFCLWFGTKLRRTADKVTIDSGRSLHEVWWLGSAIAGAAAVFFTANGLDLLLNPSYWALQRLLGTRW